MSDFSERLRWAVTDPGYTQGWVAARFNERTGGAVTSATVGRWINGVNQPTLEQIEVLASVLGISPCWMAFGVGQPHSSRVQDLPDDALETRDQVRAAKKRRDQQAG